MDQFVELLHEINIAQIFVIFAGFWIFYNRLDKKIQKSNDDLTGKIDKIETRLTRVENDMIEIKTILRFKECCMIADERHSKKLNNKN